MKKITSIVFLFFLLTTFEVSANRALYVDNFAAILGDLNAEDELLSYSQSNGIETLLLYDLHIINANYSLADPSSNTILADFISKAKTLYGILEVGATAENSDFFANVIDPYNNSRTDANEKFDIYNLEFEFWIQASTDPGGYYCTTYLAPNGFPCTNNGAFQFFISTLEFIRNLATTNTHPISTEAYVGWPTAGQADTIADHLDQLRVHAYVSDPSAAFNYSENRLIDLAGGNPGLDVSIIFSSEPSFMQNWLENNSMTAAETIYTTDWQNASVGWNSNVDLIGFTYFAYGFNSNVTLSTNSNQALENSLRIYPNPIQSILTVEASGTIEQIHVFDPTGRLIFSSNDTQLDFTGLAPGIYTLQITTEDGNASRKIAHH